MGLSRCFSVSEIARRAGLEPRLPTLPQPVREEAARLYADGLTLVEVSGSSGSATTSCAPLSSRGVGLYAPQAVARLAEDHSRGVMRIGFASCDDR